MVGYYEKILKYQIEIKKKCMRQQHENENFHFHNIENCLGMRNSQF